MKTKTAGRIAFAVCAFLFCVTLTSAHASASNEEKVDPPTIIRVAWFDYDGFNMTDDEGYHSGYNYDYLQEIARYGGWKYEYVTSTAAKCIQMLESGEVDLIGSITRTPARSKTMEFSSFSMGKNFSVLTVRADNANYQMGDTASFNGITIGTLNGDARQGELEVYSIEMNFRYKVIGYDTPVLMENALKSGEVDAILTTNMRVATSQERIIAQFAPVDFYFATQKGNMRIMQPINDAMEQIEFSRKDFRSELSQKYFSVDMSGALTLTDDELAFITAHPKIIVVLPSLRRPMAYKENGVYNGVIVDIFNELAKRINVELEYIEASDQMDAISLIKAGQADILANTYNDYGWAEMNSLFLSRPYMNLDYVALASPGTDLLGADLKAAAVKGYRFSKDFIQGRFSDDRIVWCENEEECINAVQAATADVCFVSTYVAAEYLQDYKYRNLYSSIISYTHGLSAGLSRHGNQLLLSIVDKGIASMGKAKINALIVENTMTRVRKPSFYEMLLRNPVPFTIIFGVFIMVTVALVAMLLISKSVRRKNQELYRAKLAAERDSLTGLYNRLSFELLVNELLEEKHGSQASAFIMLDIDDFKQINDVNGHSFGDKVLITFANCLNSLFDGDNALLCRMGGDEFAIFMINALSRDALLIKLETATHVLSQNSGIAATCSLGVAFNHQQSGKDFRSLYELADSALYNAKRNGKGRVYVAGE